MKFYALLLIHLSTAVCNDNFYQFTLMVLNSSIKSDDCVKFFCDMTYECDYVKNAVMNLNIPTMDVTVMRTSKDYFLCADYYLVVSNNLTKLRELFRKLVDLNKWEFRTHSRILIFYQGRGKFDQEEFTLATHRYGYDILVAQNFSIYDPVIFYTKSTLKPIQGYEVISLKYKTSLANFNNETILVHKKLFRFNEWEPIFNNWTFDIAIGDCPPFVIKGPKSRYGIDIEIVETATKSWPTKYVDYHMEIPYGAMQADLLENKVNLALCSQWRESIWSMGLAISFPYSQHCSTFLVPKPYIDETISYTFKPIQEICWLIIAISVFALALLITTYAKIYLSLKRKSSYLNYIYSVVDVFKILLMNCPKFPPATFLAFRIIFNSWCLTAMLITTSYSAGYTTVLTYPKLSKFIDTFEDMANQNIRWGGMGNYVKETVSMSLNSAINKMYKNYCNDCTTYDVNHRIRFHKDFAVFVKALPEKYITDIDYLNEFAKKNLRVLPQCTRVNFAVFAFNRNSPFPRYFDKYIKIFLECGLIRAWFTRNKHMDFKSMEHFYRIYGQANHTAVPLNMKKLEGAFHLLGIGLAGALVVFVSEVISDKMKSGRNLLI